MSQKTDVFCSILSSKKTYLQHPGTNSIAAQSTFDVLICLKNTKKVCIYCKPVVPLHKFFKRNTMQDQLSLFDGQLIRYVWDENEEKYFFSVVDIISVLTESSTPRRYWSDLKHKLQAEGSELYDKIVQLKVTAPDGKLRLTDDNWRKNLAIRLSPSSAQWTSLPLPKNCRSSQQTIRSSSNCKEYLFFRQRCESIVAFSFLANQYS